ncbi:hypothetical protein [Streptomyces sp. NPDC006355]|uniref:hypothetical protein n=1 Tax=Streptomyces sp. NPDC006355 TaxID=3156758 RepID=UPI0033BE03E5
MPADRAQDLEDIDPWWNPPWHLTWQLHYYRARDAAAGRFLQAENGFNDLDDSGVANWLWRQCSTYDELHPEQRQLLADIGITPGVARTALKHAVQPRRDQLRMWKTRPAKPERLQILRLPPVRAARGVPPSRSVPASPAVASGTAPT